MRIWCPDVSVNRAASPHWRPPDEPERAHRCCITGEAVTAPLPSSPSLFDLTGRRALVTGSSSGIGLELARGLAQHGASVVLNGRDKDRLEAAIRQLRSEGLEASAAPFDVTNEAGVKAGVAEALAAGRIDILVNNAGIQRRVPLLDVTLEVWEEVLRNNLTSALLVSREVAPQMIARGGGKIICTLSLMSELGRRTTGPYTASRVA